MVKGCIPLFRRPCMLSCYKMGSPAAHSAAAALTNPKEPARKLPRNGLTLVKLTQAGKPRKVWVGSCNVAKHDATGFHSKTRARHGLLRRVSLETNS